MPRVKHQIGAKIIEGDQISPNEWDFGHVRGDKPLCLQISSKHPDGPGFYRHPYWRSQSYLEQTLFWSEEYALKRLALWTKTRRIKFLQREPLFWDSHTELKRGWLTSSGRNKYARNSKDLGEPFAALSLEAHDFQHGCSMEQLYWLHQYRCVFGRPLETGVYSLKGMGKLRRQACKLRMNLEKSCPKVRAEFEIYQEIFRQERKVSRSPSSP